MANDLRRPIKVVLPQNIDFKDPEEKGGGFDPLCEVDDDYRSHYVSQVDEVRSTFQSSLAEGIPAVAKVVLKDKAKSKSYRPDEILNEDTCPIIGVTRAGTLLTSVTTKGLDKLESKIRDATTKTSVAHLSTLETISPFTESDALSNELKQETDGEERENSLKIKLFRHGNKQADATLDAAFEAYAKENGMTGIAPVRYGNSTKVYRCAAGTVSTASKIASFAGTQSVSKMPIVRLVRTASRQLGPVTVENFPAPELDIEYPVVGIFDTGTDPNNKLLQDWVVGRMDCHPMVAQDNTHGSFVAGLMANGRHLNNGDLRFPDSSAKIVDIVVFNNSYEVEESDLIMFIEDALVQFPEVRIWNLSLASSEPCSDDQISDFGATLDEFRSTYGVLFVTAAGNMSSPPYRRWPVETHFVGQDRLAPPGDSVCGLTVGGLAHLDNEKTCVKKEQVSPFSRRGPGLGGQPKPELSHYSGNCDEQGNCMQTGIISMNAQAELIEDIGVSYGTPLVSAIAGGVESELRVGPDTSSPSLVKAMMVHSAHVQNHPITANDIEYTGVGRPPDVAEIVSCRESAATIVFQIPVERRPRFYKNPFPMPPCLVKNGILKCEVFMTLLYDPPMERSWGIEYCRRNVVASLGFLELDPDTGAEKYKGRQIHPSPDKLRQRYPDDIADIGFDWAPLKLYYRKFSQTQGDKQWRLSLTVRNRAECLDEEPMPATLIVTVKSPDENDQVYTEMVQGMNALGWVVQNLELRSRERGEFGGDSN